MNVVDLFAGCGGMSLGFHLAGNKTLLASEKDEWASETYKANHSGTKVITGDICLVKDWRNHVGNKTVDGVIGGPPCQGFSLSGNRDKSDPRNSLFMEFIRCVKELQPKFFVMENVPGLLSMKTAKGQKVSEIIKAEFRAIGYKVAYDVLNAADFGVPQTRERVFFIGVKEGIPYCKSEIFPKPTTALNRRVCALDAISDLPQVNSGEGEESQEYPKAASNKYQEWCRQSSKEVLNHVAMRHTQRIIERFKVIQAGQSVADVSEEHSATKRGDPTIKSGKVFGQNNMRVHAHKPSPTVAASFQSNFIHPKLDRNFTAREGARLQSFPDHYVFKGKRTTMSWEKNLSQYQQIGNAVPPLLAKAIAESVMKYLKNAEDFIDDTETIMAAQLDLDLKQ